ncbi:porin [Pedobacter sp.]|uniref:porin n=1 Tax=Pedobacter sp. TaxID=1411316 RepID=UPI003D7F5D14
MKKILTLGAALATSFIAYGQDEPRIKVSGYLETYFGYDYNRPADNNRPGFIYSHNRHNEVNLNLGFIKGTYDNDGIRANLALMTGTYTNANLAAEPGVLKNIFEANAGVRLSKTANLWLDAGVFPSHIGFESAISKDCWVLTRNISSENTPYYESGAKISYGTTDGKLTFTALYLNGWQRITRQNSNSLPAGGLQLIWKPSARVTLNYSNYLGSEGADSVRVRRFYHNFYGIIQFTDQLGLTVGLDYGTQQKARGSDEKSEVISPVAIAQYKISDKWAVAGRVENYKDKNGIFIATGIPEGFNGRGYSLNIDFSPLPNAVLRLEEKLYDAQSTNTTLTASFAVSF